METSYTRRETTRNTPCAHVLSRLKGMETFSELSFGASFSMCTCAFPFEGNGNQHWMRETETRLLSSAHVLSRLKGMETLPSFCLFLIFIKGCTCAFPFEGNGNSPMVAGALKTEFTRAHVLSRLKGMETHFHQRELVLSWRAHVLSRLKGMETNFPLSSCNRRYGVHMCFPV